MKKLSGLGALLTFALTACASSDGVGEQQSTWDKSCSGVDKSYDTQLLTMRDEIAPPGSRN